MAAGETVGLGWVVQRAAEESYLSLRELVDKSKTEATGLAEGGGSGARSDNEKKIDLLKFIARTRQRMLRLHVLTKWCQQVPLVQYCQQLGSTLSSHETCFTQAADSLFFMHEGLQQARAPLFDVPSSIEVLSTGSYQRLPKCIEDIGLQNALLGDEQRPALAKLDTLLQSKLLETVIPREITNVTVSEGIVILCVDGEFRILLTLGYRGHLSLWRILHMELLVGDKNGPLQLEETRRYDLGDDLERRMAVSENPFVLLYNILHELCISLVMATVVRQTQVLIQGRWKDAIKFECITDGLPGQVTGTAVAQLGQDGGLDMTALRIPSLKITYWLKLERSCGSTDSDFFPFIRIEAGQDMQIKCTHSFVILDPLTDKEASLYLDLSCIDVEKLLLRAISCGKHTRLIEIMRELQTSVQICQSSDDVVLKHQDLERTGQPEEDLEGSTKDYFTSEALQVRAYGQSYILLGINIRSGRFVLQLSNHMLPPAVQLKAEDDLNKAVRTATDIFVGLRTKSILHQFASAGHFFGLKVYDQSQNTLRIPKSISHGSDHLLLGFPQCGSTYFLSIQLDGSFKPVFHLLESQYDHSDKFAPQIARCNRIDVGQMQTIGIKADLGELEGLRYGQNVALFSKTPDPKLSPLSRSELTLRLPGMRTSFSSAVDEVFGSNLETLGSIPEGNHLPSPGSISYLDSISTVSFPELTARLGLLKQEKEAMQSHAATVSRFVNPNSNLLGNTNTSRTSIGDLSAMKLLTPFSRYTDVRQCSLLLDDNSLCDEGKAPALGENSTPDKISNMLSRKRPLREILVHISSIKSDTELSKRRRISSSNNSCHLVQSNSATSKPCNNTRENIQREGIISLPQSLYSSFLFHVIRHCLLSIKHAQLTSQMDALDISYVEEVDLRSPSSNIWLRLPFARDDSWKQICLCLGKTGGMSWYVRINDPHYRDLWELQRGSKSSLWGFGVRIANTSEIDSHISFDSDGVILTYETVVAGSVQKLVSDLRRLSNARLFSCLMRKLVGVKSDDKQDEHQMTLETKVQPAPKSNIDAGDRLSDHLRKAFRIEAVGLMSLWFSYGSMPMVHFVVEWEAGKEGCTMHVSPDQLWPHTKYLEDYVNGGDVASFLDCVCLTAGPLLALGGAIRPARMPASVSGGYITSLKPNNGPLQGTATTASPAHSIPPSSLTSSGAAVAHLGNPAVNTVALLSAAGRGVPGLGLSTLLPFDVSVVLRGPYWVRIIYRKKFSVDMRCFAGDQVWLQPATPPKGGPLAGGSLPCPHFRPFIMEHVAQGLHTFDPTFMNSSHPGLPPNSSNINMTSSSAQPSLGNAIGNVNSTATLSRAAIGVGSQVVTSLGRANNSTAPLSGPGSAISFLSVRQSPGSSVPVHIKGELNTAFIGLGDDGGYGGGWVPLAALKKVIRAILKYLGVLWLFSQLPDLLKEILGTLLKENEGALLNLDPDQPALRFFVGGYVFAVSIHRVQLLLQVLSVKRLHNHQLQQAQTNSQEELAQSEINEIGDYFSRRVASEPYDASRVASFITLLTVPISVFREFLKLIAWKRELSQVHGGDIATAQKARIELCLENHSGLSLDGNTESSSTSKSNIYHDRANNLVEFALTYVLDNSLIPHMVAAGGAAWLPYCVSVRLRYSFSDGTQISFLGMDGSHGGRACWLQSDEWEKCKQRVARAVESVNGPAAGDASQGRLRLVAEKVQKTLQGSLQLMRDGTLSAGSAAS